MAIKNQSDNYLRVVEVRTGQNLVMFETYKDADVRENTGRFDLVEQGYLICGTLQESLASVTTTGNILNDLKTAGYIALKNEPPYNGASGETWVDC